MSADENPPTVDPLVAERFGIPRPPVPDALADVDSILALWVEQEEAKRPLQGVDAIAVHAILALSRAGMDLMTEASHAGSRDAERLSRRARRQLDEARRLMTEFATEREAVR